LCAGVRRVQVQVHWHAACCGGVPPRESHARVEHPLPPVPGAHPQHAQRTPTSCDTPAPGQACGHACVLHESHPHLPDGAVDLEPRAKAHLPHLLAAGHAAERLNVRQHVPERGGWAGAGSYRGSTAAQTRFAGALPCCAVAPRRPGCRRPGQHPQGSWELALPAPQQRETGTASPQGATPCPCQQRSPDGCAGHVTETEQGGAGGLHLHGGEHATGWAGEGGHSVARVFCGGGGGGNGRAPPLPPEAAGGPRPPPPQAAVRPPGHLRFRAPGCPLSLTRLLTRLPARPPARPAHSPPPC